LRSRLGGIESQPVQHRVDARRDRIAAFTLEALEIFAVVFERSVTRVVLQALRLFHERLLERKQLGELAGGRFPHRRGVPEVAMLLQQRHAQARLARDLAAGRRHFAGEQAKQRRLPRAVSSDDAPSVAGADGERDVLEQRHRAELHGDAGCGDLCHFVVQLFHSCSARPTVSALPFRTSGMRRSSGSSMSLSSQVSSEYRAWRSPSSSYRFESLSMSRSSPNFCTKRRSSPSEAARSFKSTKCVLIRRSAKNRRALRVSELFFTPKIWTSVIIVPHSGASHLRSEFRSSRSSFLTPALRTCARNSALQDHRSSLRRFAPALGIPLSKIIVPHSGATHLRSEFRLE